MRKALLSTMIVAMILSVTGSVRAADTYNLDPVHSMVVFRIGHQGISYTYGRFNSPTGTITIDAANPAASKFEVSVKAANVDTDNQARDNHLKNADFFNVQQYPDITFKSTAVKADGTGYEVTGDLTMHGVTKPVTVKLAKTGEGERQGKKKIGFEGTFEIKCSDYGMTFLSKNNQDDSVRLTVSIEAGM